jgi:hypothetical protein
MFDPVKFIPQRKQVAAMTTYPTPYELAWQELHSGKPLSLAIEAVRQTLGVTYDLASSLVWAEVGEEAPLVPA